MPSRAYISVMCFESELLAFCFVCLLMFMFRITLLLLITLDQFALCSSVFCYIDACRRAANHFSPVFYWFLRDLRYMFVAFLLPQLIIWWRCISSWVCLCMCVLALALLEANLYFIDNILAINLQIDPNNLLMFLHLILCYSPYP